MPTADVRAAFGFPCWRGRTRRADGTAVARASAAPCRPTAAGVGPLLSRAGVGRGHRRQASRMVRPQRRDPCSAATRGASTGAGAPPWPGWAMPSRAGHVGPYSAWKPAAARRTAGQHRMRPP